jgi:hypothetical protein
MIFSNYSLNGCKFQEHPGRHHLNVAHLKADASFKNEVAVVTLNSITF